MRHHPKIRDLITLAAALLVVALGIVALVHLGATLHPAPAAAPASASRLIDPSDYPHAREGLVPPAVHVQPSPTMPAPQFGASTVIVSDWAPAGQSPSAEQLATRAAQCSWVANSPKSTDRQRQDCDLP
jgi:hypothetical protein